MTTIEILTNGTPGREVNALNQAAAEFTRISTMRPERWADEELVVLRRMPELAQQLVEALHDLNAFLPSAKFAALTGLAARLRAYNQGYLTQRLKGVRACAACGKHFLPRRNGQKHCSLPCRKAWKNALAAQHRNELAFFVGMCKGVYNPNSNLYRVAYDHVKAGDVSAETALRRLKENDKEWQVEATLYGVTLDERQMHTKKRKPRGKALQKFEIVAATIPTSVQDDLRTLDGILADANRQTDGRE